MLRNLLARFFGWVNKQIKVPDFQEEDIHISWADFEDKGKAKIIFYSVDTCGVCKELELWLSNNWIPHKIVHCKLIHPALVPKLRTLNGLIGFNAKCGGKKNTLFLHQSFPQVDFVSRDGKWTRTIANSKIVRSEIEKFLFDNMQDYPGFESGIYGDKTPGNQAAEQVANVLNFKAEGK